MKKYFCSLIVFVVFSFIFQACVPQQLEINPGFGKKAPSETPKTPIPKLAEGPEAKKPIWKVGYKWTYNWKRPGRSGIRTRRIIREDTFNGIPCFVMKAGRNEYFYTKDVLGYLGSKRRGKLRRQRDAPFQPFAWPLKVGRQWNNVYTFERVDEETSFDVDLRVVVSKLEEVTVPAGKFKTFKIEVYRSYDSELVSEWWYSPKVKWYVKWISYVGRGTRPREARLKSYTVD